MDNTRLALLAFGWAAVGWSLAADGVADAIQIPPRVLAFAGEKERFVKAQAVKLKVEAMPMALDYFETARKGHWAQAMELYKEVSEFLRAEAKDESQSRLDAITSQAALELQLALEAYAEGDAKLALSFGEMIVNSVPAGSVYFGGTDPGRGMPAALCASHERGEPFFVLTQGSLISDRYRQYLEAMYTGKLEVPSKKDSDEAFSEYLKDAERRMKHDQEFPTQPKQLLPGEKVTIRNNRINVSGSVAVMQINGILLKRMLEKNPGREFYIEENYPVGWMYPHLTPHGLILKLNRQAPASISLEMMERDRKFWLEQQRALIGSWLQPGTPVKEVCAFAGKVFAQRNLDGFTGNASFVQSEKSGVMFLKPRVAIAGVYEWRATNAKDKAERERMSKEADFAFRQAFAMCPANVECVMRYAAFLVANGRKSEARLVADTAVGVNPGNGELEKLAADLGGTER